VSLPFPSQHPLGEFVAAERRSPRCACEPSDEKHVAIQLTARDLEKECVAKPVCREKPNARLCCFRYDFVVRLYTRF
jgi:hypothetical protein